MSSAFDLLISSYPSAVTVRVIQYGGEGLTEGGGTPPITRVIPPSIGQGKNIQLR